MTTNLHPAGKEPANILAALAPPYAAPKITTVLVLLLGLSLCVCIVCFFGEEGVAFALPLELVLSLDMFNSETEIVIGR
jgi:hypothetical protein